MARGFHGLGQQSYQQRRRQKENEKEKERGN
jgi:hypothetical protein